MVALWASGEAMVDGMREAEARARAEALFRKDDERALGSPRASDVAQAEQAEKTARLRALRLAKEEADLARGAVRPRS